MNIFKKTLNSKRKGAVGLEYIIVFPSLVLVLALMVCALLLILNVMKYNDIATQTANNANFSPTAPVSTSSTCISSSGGTTPISNQCSQYINSTYSPTYLYNSPYTAVQSITVTQIRGVGATNTDNHGTLLYINIHYTIFGLSFTSTGMNIIF